MPALIAPGPGPVPAGRGGPSGLRSARQPPRQRQHVLRARVLEAAEHDRPAPRGVDRERRSLPQLGGRPDGARADRARRGGHRRRLGLARPGCRQHRATPLLDHAVRRRAGPTGRRRRAAGRRRDALRASQALAPQRPAFGRGVRRPAGRPRHHRRRRGRSRHRPVRAAASSTTRSRWPSSPPRCNRPPSPTRRCGGSPTRRSATRARRSGPTGRASCPSGCFRSSRPAGNGRSPPQRFAVVAAIWIAATAGVDVRGGAPATTGGPDRGGAPRRPRREPATASATCARVALGAAFAVRGGIDCWPPDRPRGPRSWRRSGDGRPSGGAGSGPRRRGGPLLRARAGRRTGPGRPFTVRGHSRWHPQCPLPLLLQAIEEGVGGRASSCAAVVALGTHAPMSDAAIAALVGPTTIPDRQPRLVGGRHLRARGHAAGELVRELSGGGSTTPSTSASIGSSSRVT